MRESKVGRGGRAEIERRSLLAVPPVFGLVSPHPDDVALSCTRFLQAHPGSHVVTVFAGGPTSVDPLPLDWDALSGILQPGDDVPSIRRREDAAACALVRAVPHHLSFWDEQYRSGTYSYDGEQDEDLVPGIAAALTRVIRELPVDVWVMPLGLMHHDHQLTAAACLRSFRELNIASPAPPAETRWMLYRELPHMVAFPEALEAAEQHVRDAGFHLEPASVEVSIDLARKRAAIACHLSQLEMLWSCIDTAVIAPESFYRLEWREDQTDHSTVRHPQRAPDRQNQDR
jgi:LmbE family N-acetylglucosaminyl deacetylase